MKSDKYYTQSTVLDKEKISRFLQGKGYKILEINQPWRNLHAIIQKGKNIFFLNLLPQRI
jgi:hypothetical protein